MAQSGYTPILIYGSGTASNIPSAANLTSSANGAELALNYADGKLYYKNSSGVVTLLASAAAASGTSPGGSTTQVQYNNAGAFGGSANFVFDGTNVGIGASSPADRLDVRQAGVAARFTSTNGNANQIALSNSATAVVGFYMGSPAANVLQFSDSTGTERMRIDSSGNVSIGVTPPTVYGDTPRLLLYGGASSTSPTIEVSQNGTGVAYHWQMRNGNGVVGWMGSNNTSFVFGTGTSTERMRIDSSGNVGIGTSSPSSKLHVYGVNPGFRVEGDGGSYYPEIRLDGANGTMFLTTYYGATITATNATGNNTIRFRNGGTTSAGAYGGSDKMIIDSSGNVGIGTTSPGYRLTVESNTLIYTDSVSSNNYSLTNGGTNYGGGVAPYLTVAGAGGSYGYLLIKGGSGGTSNTANMGMANKNNGGNYILGAILGCEVTSAVAGSESQYFKIATQDAGTGVADRIRITNANLYLTSQTTTSNATVFSIAAYQNGYPATGQYGSIDFVNGSPWYSGGRIVFKTNGNADITNTSPTERARISSTGGFSVGTTADPGAGAIYATGNITAYYSDARLKDVKGTIANALDKVSSLSGVYYTNNEVAVAHGYTSADTQVGLLAQDVEAVLPEVVKAAPFDLDERGDSKSGEHYKTVQYERIIPLLVEAIKELRAEVKALRG